MATADAEVLTGCLSNLDGDRVDTNLYVGSAWRSATTVDAMVTLLTELAYVVLRYRDERKSSLSATPFDAGLEVAERVRAIMFQTGVQLTGLERFVYHKLDVKVSDHQLEATVSALLSFDFDDLKDADAGQIAALIKKRTQYEHHLWRPLGETRIAGQEIDYLDRVVTYDPVTGRPVTVAELCSPSTGDASTAPPDVVRFEDPRIAKVLQQLDEDEARIAILYALDGTVTWAQAAVREGQAAQFGERVRRKLKRLGREYLKRRPRMEKTPVASAKAVIAASIILTLRRVTAPVPSVRDLPRQRNRRRP